LAANQKGKKVTTKEFYFLNCIQIKRINFLKMKQVFFLSDNIETSVREYYTESNQKLGELLNRDLTQLGHL
jgi:hypothetical protein